MQIDESWRDDETGGVDVNLAAQPVGRDYGDFMSGYADAAHGIEAGLGVHHPAALEDDVVGLRGEKTRKQAEQGSHDVSLSEGNHPWSFECFDDIF
jgi:hypothetical protein